MNETNETQVQINCSQTRYNTSGIQIVGWANSDKGNGMNFTFNCEDSPYQVELECGMLYSVYINWTTSLLATCLLNSKTDIYLTCPRKYYSYTCHWMYYYGI